MRHLRAIAAALFLLALSAPVLAQSPTPLSVVSSRQYGEGVDRVFEFKVANSGERPVAARGRLVVINVYAATLPLTIPVREIVVPPGASTTAVVRWDDAPLLGQVRALLVLNDGQHASLVESYTFWIVPYLETAVFLAIAALLIALALGAMRLPKYLKTRVPANMMPYVVEFDDTVVTLAARFDVTWQDIVRANRLKPPYTLKPGGRVLIPKHGLRRPEPETKA
ncbi:MAG TPA: LysM peptidoglycan-binding domain-containing protein [Patescibacteria group bacterium]|nr:LysM peptidoglycan-binding domain-containing protein [Patescibacteria group bacterium]